uniref:GED domain-containing protein n=1 Tax=Tetranychus urticae TaxID=32264 RepID=T1KXA1_TETUR
MKFSVNALMLYPKSLIYLSRQIRRLEEPSLKCVDLVHEEMVAIIQHCDFEIQQELLRFPKLHEKIIDAVTTLLRRRLPPTNTMVHNLVFIELAYINTRHPDFHEAQLIGTLMKNAEIDQKKKYAPNNALPAPDDEASSSSNELVKAKPGSSLALKLDANMIWSTSNKKAISQVSEAGDNMNDLDRLGGLSGPDVPANREVRLTSKEQRDCTVIEKLIRSYFLIVRKNIQDSVPKAIMYFLVNFVRDNLQSELVTHLYKKEDFDELLSESEHIAVHRKNELDIFTD